MRALSSTIWRVFCSGAAFLPAAVLAVSCTTTSPGAAETPRGEGRGAQTGRQLDAGQARAMAMAEARMLEERAGTFEEPAPAEGPVAEAAAAEDAAAALPEVDFGAPAQASPEERERLVEEHLRSVLEAERRAKIEAVQQRIFYPEELWGAPMVRTDALGPGMVIFYYPLRATGGVTATIDNMTVTAGNADDASVDELKKHLAQYLDADAGEKVDEYKNLNMLQITAREENMPFILDILSFLDSPSKQVILEAAVWEITETKDTQLAASVSIAAREGATTFFKLFENRFDTQSFLNSLTSGAPFQGSILEFVNTADGHGARMDAVFQFVESLGYADLVAQPRLRVSSGEVARIITGEKVPINTLTKLINDRTELRVDYENVGVELSIMPMLVGQDLIQVALASSVSEVTGYTQLGIIGVVNPIISQRKAATKVVVANRELITIGGLDQTRKTITETKVPLLGDIPILKYLFSSRREHYKKIQVWFTVRPTIAGETERIILPELTGAR